MVSSCPLGRPAPAVTAGVTADGAAPIGYEHRMDPSSRAAISVALARLAGGDRSAQRTVFEAVWPIVRDFCRKMLATAADAEDAAQQAIIRTFAQASDYDVSRDGLAWVLEISLWECRTMLRRRARSREHELSAQAMTVPDLGASPEEAAERRDLEAALAAALGGLTQADRAALADGLTGEQAGVAPATWRKRRERALSRLRLLWRSQHDS